MRRTYFDWFLITLSVIVFAGGLVYLLYFWDSIPDMVPVHFNARGEIDGYDNKSSIFIIVALEAIMMGTVIATAFVPKFWNVPNKDSSPLVRSSVKVMLELMALIFALFFTGMFVIISKGISIPTWYMMIFFFVIVGLSFMPYIFAVIARLKKK